MMTSNEMTAWIKAIQAAVDVDESESEVTGGKECAACGTWLPLIAYKVDSECSGGRRATCRACIAARHPERKYEFRPPPDAKILFFDIETDGVNPLYADLGFVICFGYKWAGDLEASVLTIDLKSLHNFDDRKLLTEASALYEQADLVVAHYGANFDRRFIQGRLLINNLPPIPPTKMRDTCLIARSIAKFRSNRLEHLAEILGLDEHKYRKVIPDEWPGWWYRVMRGDQGALMAMAAYCKQDVETLEAVYYRLTAADQPHPRLVPRGRCAVCGGEIEYHGKAFVGQNSYRRFVCKKCGRWDRERTALRNG